MGIEPTSEAWEASILPLYDARSIAFDSTQSHSAVATAWLTKTEDPVRLVALANRYSHVSVPKILTLFIPEILSHPAIAGRAKTLSVPPVGEPVGPREEDVRNVKASRSRDSTEGRSLQGGSGPAGGSVPVPS